MRTASIVSTPCSLKSASSAIRNASPIRFRAPFGRPPFGAVPFVHNHGFSSVLSLPLTGLTPSYCLRYHLRMARAVTCKGCGVFADPLTHRCPPKGGEARNHSPHKAQPQAKVETPSSGADYIVYRRDRAKWNAYMRAYRARKKAMP
jgi:hypothetical protein